MAELVGQREGVLQQRRPAGCLSGGSHVEDDDPRACHQLLDLGLGIDTSSGGGEDKTLISKDYTQVWYHVRSLTVCDKKGVQ